MSVIFRKMPTSPPPTEAIEHMPHQPTVSTPLPLTETEAAKIVGVQPRTLQNWRYRGMGPPFLRYSARCIRYRLEDLLAWQASRSRVSTSDRGPESSDD